MNTQWVTWVHKDWINASFTTMMVEKKNGYAKKLPIQLGEKKKKNSKLPYFYSNTDGVVVLGSHAGSIIVIFFFFCLLCRNETSRQRTVVDNPAAVNDMMFWCVDHLLSSNLWVNNCQWHLVMTHFTDVMYCLSRSTSITAVCQNVWPLLSHIFTPLNEQSHSLNSFLLIDFISFLSLCTVPWWRRWLLKSNPWWES